MSTESHIRLCKVVWCIVGWKQKINSHNYFVWQTNGRNVRCFWSNARYVTANSFPIPSLFFYLNYAAHDLQSFLCDDFCRRGLFFWTLTYFCIRMNVIVVPMWIHIWNYSWNFWFSADFLVKCIKFFPFGALIKMINLWFE